MRRASGSYFYSNLESELFIRIFGSLFHNKFGAIAIYLHFEPVFPGKVNRFAAKP